MPLLGELAVRLIADTAAYKASMQSAASEVKGFGTNADEAGGKSDGFLNRILGIAGFTSVADAVTVGWEKIGEAISSTIEVTKEHEIVAQQTLDVIKSTGGASGQTAASISAMADKYSKLTMFSDDAIQSSENMLETFTNIKGNVFPQAEVAVLNVAQAMGEDTKSAAIQLGKALNDPAKGLTALQRIGVTFDDTQKTQIANFLKAGNLAGAQAVELKELNKEFGNSAVGAGSTMAGGLAILSHEVENVQEKIGGALEPVLAKLLTAAMPLIDALGNGLVNAFTEVSEWLTQASNGFGLASDTLEPLYTIVSYVTPHVQALSGVFSGVLVPALQSFIPSGGQLQDMWTLWQNTAVQLAPIIGNLASTLLDGLGTAVTNLSPLISGLGTLFTGTIIPAFMALEPHMVTLFSAVANIIPPVISFATAVEKVGVTILTALIPVAQKLLPILIQIQGWVADQLSAALSNIAPVIQKAADTVSTFADQLSVKMGPALNNIMTVVGDVISFIQPLWNAAWPAIQKVFEGVWQVIQGVVQIAWSILSNTFSFWLDVIGGNWSGAWKDIQNMFSGIWSGIQKVFGGVITAIFGSMQTWTGNLGKMFTSAGQNILSSLTNAVINGSSSFIRSLTNMAGNALSAVKGVFGIHSPSTEFAAIGNNISLGLLQGVTGVDVANGVANHMAGALDSTTTALAGSGGSSGDSGAAPGASGGRPLTIVLQMPDGQELVQYLAPPMVDELRLRLGLKF